MPFDANGRWLSVEDTIRQINERRLDVQDFKAEQKRPKTDPAVEVRGYYERLVGSTTKRFGPTSFDNGKGLSDQRAFDHCVTEFGYVRAVVALAEVSVRAGQLKPTLKARSRR